MFCVLRDQLSVSLEQSLHILHGKEMREAQYELSRCLSVSFCGVHLCREPESQERLRWTVS